MGMMPQAPDNDEDYVIVNLPMRLEPDQLALLNAAAARAPISKNMGISLETREKAQLARFEAGRLIKLRRQRARVFGNKLFADPAWDMLLDLFVRRVDEHTTSVSSACIGSQAPATTALRHMAVLLEHGLIVKIASSTDQRVQYVTLSDDGFQHMVDVLTPIERYQRASA